MEFNIFEYGAYVSTGVVGWFAGVVWRRQEEMKQEFSSFREDLPLNYVRKDDFKEAVRDLKESFRETVIPIMNKLDRIEERMDEQVKENDRIYQRK